MKFLHILYSVFTAMGCDLSEKKGLLLHFLIVLKALYLYIMLVVLNSESCLYLQITEL